MAYRQFQPAHAGTGERPLTTAQVAKRENVTTRTVERWCRDGRIPCWRTSGGTHWRIPRDYAERAAAARDPEA